MFPITGKRPSMGCTCKKPRVSANISAQLPSNTSPDRLGDLLAAPRNWVRMPSKRLNHRRMAILRRCRLFHRASDGMGWQQCCRPLSFLDIKGGVVLVATVIISAPARVKGVTQRQLRAKTPGVFAHLNWWLVAVVTLAVSLSVTACIVAFQNHTILLYSDAYSHMIIARRVTDNPTPGLAQLGGVWLPLPHVIMMPFVWSMFLWSSGLGGAIPSMICYVISAIYIFLAARRVTKRDGASFLGTLVFLLNPNMLYVQSTPLSEPVMILTMTMTSYYFLAWVQEGRQNDLIWAALCTFFASLARYDGWPLYLVIMMLIVIIGKLKHQTAKEIKGNLVLYGALGGFGIALWFLWNQVIFGNGLYFLNG